MMLPTAFSRISFSCADDTLFNGPSIFVKFLKDVVVVNVDAVDDVVVVDVVVEGSFKDIFYVLK